MLPGQPDATYYVQLPPEYNPQRRYPMIVSLHGIGHDPPMQIDWWAGEHAANGPPGRKGQAGRYGYIVIAPAWTVEHQKEYEYSAREHALVLGCVRDACRRFAVDTDRVFLSGHMEGGDAAWDIGVSHPDLWAGVIPISAEAQEDLQLLHRERPPRAVLCRAGRVGRRPHRPRRPGPGPLSGNGYNTTVVEYLGRGHEHFLDEQLPLFDWMNRCKRSFPLPREREGTHEREFDLQDDAARRQLLLVGGNREPAAQLHRDGLDGSPRGEAVHDGLGPAHRLGGGVSAGMPIPPGTRPLLVQGSVPASNTLVLTAGNSRATIWLSPEMVNFNARINISVGGRRPSGVPAMIKPSVETMLEDLPRPRRPPAPVLGEGGDKLEFRTHHARRDAIPHAGTDGAWSA